MFFYGSETDDDNVTHYLREPRLGPQNTEDRGKYFDRPGEHWTVYPIFGVGTVSGTVKSRRQKKGKNVVETLGPCSP